MGLLPQGGIKVIKKAEWLEAVRGLVSPMRPPQFWPQVSRAHTFLDMAKLRGVKVHRGCKWKLFSPGLNCLGLPVGMFVTTRRPALFRVNMQRSQPAPAQSKRAQALAARAQRDRMLSSAVKGPLAHVRALEKRIWAGAED